MLNNTFTSSFKNEIDNLLSEALDAYNLPGLSVYIGKGSYSYNKSCGFSDYKSKELLTKDHFFHMASLSKLFVAMSIMTLIEANKLSLNDKVIDILPWLRINDSSFGKVTIQHLLSHTSGLDNVKDFNWNKPLYGLTALPDYLKSKEISSLSLMHSADDNKFSYSDIGYEILGAVISQISKLPFEDYISNTFFSPLNMKNSTFLPQSRLINYECVDGVPMTINNLKNANFALPHSANKDGKIINLDYYPYNRCHGPSSTLNSTLEDMSKWARALLSRNFISSNSYLSMLTPSTTVPNNNESMGLAWFIREDDTTYIGHEGNDDGFRASFWLCPSSESFVIICSNTTRAPIKKISKQIFKMMG